MDNPNFLPDDERRWLNAELEKLPAGSPQATYFIQRAASIGAFDFIPTKHLGDAPLTSDVWINDSLNELERAHANPVQSADYIRKFRHNATEYLRQRGALRDANDIPSLIRRSFNASN